MKQSCLSTDSKRKNERGGVLAYTVLSSLFLFLAVGLGVDLSHLYLAKTELQNTADAAALAGATALTLPLSNPDRIPTAVNRALLTMNRNRYNFDNKDYVDVMNLADQRSLVEFAVNLDGPYMNEAAAIGTADETPNIRFIRVRTPPVPITTFFAIPILGGSQTLDARATAGLSVPGNAQYCPLPLAAVECGSDPACSFERPGICNEGGPLPNPDGSPCDPTRQLCRNCDYIIRAEPGTGIAPGNFQALCCGEGTCNNDWLRLAIAGTQNCQDCAPVNPGDPMEFLPTNPGQKQAAIRDGLNTRLDCYGPNDDCGGSAGGGINPEDHPPDPNVFGRDGTDVLNWSQYQTGSPSQTPAHDPLADRRKLVVPITSYDAWADVEGSGVVRPSRFGAFFLKQRVPSGSGPTAGEVRAEYIGPEVVSTIGFDPTLSNTTNVVTWVLYR